MQKRTIKTNSPLQSQHDRRASRSDGGIDRGAHREAHAANGNLNQKHHHAMKEMMALIKNNKKEPSSQLNE